MKWWLLYMTVKKDLHEAEKETKHSSFRKKK